MILPTLQDIPASVGAGPDDGLAALTANLLDAGLLPPAIRVSSRSELPAMLDVSLKRWVKAHAPTFHVLSLSVLLRRTERFFPNAEAQPGAVMLQVFCTDAVPLVCGPMLDRLHAVDERLPELVVRALDIGSAAAVRVLHCFDQLGIASYVHWGGCNSPEEHADECGFDEVDRDAYLQEALRPADIAAGTPQWASNPKRRLCNRMRGFYSDAKRDAYCRHVRRTLLRFARQTKDAQCAAILRSAAAFVGLQADRAFDPAASEEGAEFFGHAALVRYSEGDLLPELYGDLGNIHAESGQYYEDAFRAELAVDDARALKASLAGLEAFLQRCAAQDHLLQLLCPAHCTKEDAEHE